MRGDASDREQSRADRPDGIITIHRPGARQIFTLQEAQELLPIVFRITQTYSLKVEKLIERIDALSGVSPDATSTLEEQVSSLIQGWQNKVQMLGGLPKGLWIADFDSGDGYFCWKFPERKIEYWHQYDDGFTRRILVGERINVVPLEPLQASQNNRSKPWTIR